MLILKYNINFNIFKMKQLLMIHANDDVDECDDCSDGDSDDDDGDNLIINVK